MKTKSPKKLPPRKFFMILPLVALPFLTMIFWALGGGSDGTLAQAKTVSNGELNSDLPDAHFSGKEIWDKLSLYELASQDSARSEMARERDPYFDIAAFSTKENHHIKREPSELNKLVNSFPQKERVIADPNEEKVNAKLNELYREINHAGMPSSMTKKVESKEHDSDDLQFSSDVDRLEKMMELMNGNTEADPEMQQIEKVLEAILDIQHPERFVEKQTAFKKEEHNDALPVKVLSADDDISLFDSQPSITDSETPRNAIFLSATFQNAFYGLDDGVTIAEQSANAVEAIIHDTQELVTGSTVKMRLLNEVTIKGTIIPKDNFIYGVCTIADERLKIEIRSIRSGNSLLPVSLSVYDLDGMEGIYIPGAITRDAARNASNDAIQNIQLMSLDQSIGSQAATAGIEAAKGLFAKKSKQIKVTVKAGYNIFIQDKNTRTP